MSETNRRRSESDHEELVAVRQLPPLPTNEPRAAIHGHPGTLLSLSYSGDLQAVYDILITAGATIQQLLNGRPQG
jgi:hypothetical protein